MPSSEARLSSPKAKNYMIQLCKHFRHKVPAKWTDADAHVTFDMGTCDMRIEDELLILTCSAEDNTALGRVMAIVGDHLVRFAWREKPELSWSLRDD
ncbi:MAG: DUF2218 domain-containing protein [Pseudomonadota bacterium]